MQRLIVLDFTGNLEKEPHEQIENKTVKEPKGTGPDFLTDSSTEILQLY